MAAPLKSSSYVAVEPISHDGVYYAPGDVIDLDKAAVEQLLSLQCIAVGVADKSEQDQEK